MLPIPSTTKRGKGRPIGSSKSKDPTVKHILINERLQELLDYEKKPNERYTDTILRLLDSRTKELTVKRKKIDALEEAINSRTSHEVQIIEVQTRK